MMAMSSMHEHVHERTRQQWKPNQEPEHMGSMFGKQQRACNDQKSDQHYSGLGFRGHALSGLLPKLILN
jgi:hypothetical protein